MWLWGGEGDTDAPGDDEIQKDKYITTCAKTTDGNYGISFSDLKDPATGQPYSGKYEIYIKAKDGDRWSNTLKMEIPPYVDFGNRLVDTLGKKEMTVPGMIDPDKGEIGFEITGSDDKSAFTVEKNPDGTPKIENGSLVVEFHPTEVKTYGDTAENAVTLTITGTNKDGKPVKVTMPLTGTGEVVLRPSSSERTKPDENKVTFTSTRPGTYYYVILNTGDDTPDADEIKKSALTGGYTADDIVNGKAITFDPNDNGAGTKKVCIVLVDDSGETSNVIEMPVPPYQVLNFATQPVTTESKPVAGKSKTIEIPKEWGDVQVSGLDCTEKPDGTTDNPFMVEKNGKDGKWYVIFTPKNTGDYSGTVTVTGSVNGQTVAMIVQLTGTGVDYVITAKKEILEINGVAYTPGKSKIKVNDVLTYRVTMTNEGDLLYGIMIVDDMAGGNLRLATAKDMEKTAELKGKAVWSVAFKANTGSERDGIVTNELISLNDGESTNITWGYLQSKAREYMKGDQIILTYHAVVTESGKLTNTVFGRSYKTLDGYKKNKYMPVEDSVPAPYLSVIRFSGFSLLANNETGVVDSDETLSGEATATVDVDNSDDGTSGAIPGGSSGGNGGGTTGGGNGGSGGGTTGSGGTTGGGNGGGGTTGSGGTTSGGNGGGGTTTTGDGTTDSSTGDDDTTDSGTGDDDTTDSGNDVDDGSESTVVTPTTPAPSKPTKPANPTTPSNPTTPAPSKPTRPANPTTPSNPTTPAAPSNVNNTPTAPASPGNTQLGNTGNTQPVEPGNTDNTGDTQPAEPVSPPAGDGNTEKPGETPKPDDSTQDNLLPVDGNAEPLDDSPYEYPTYEEVTPDPNDPTSPETIVVVDGDGNPHVYVKVEDPDNPGEMIYMEDPQVPLAAAPQAGGSWALVNLILMAITILAGIVIIIRSRKRRKEDEEERNGTYVYAYEGHEEDDDDSFLQLLWKRGGWGIYGALFAIISVITFLLTEDMSLPMRYVDRWTLLMAILAVLQIPGLVPQRKRREQEARATRQ